MVLFNNFKLLIRFITKVRAVNRENGQYHKLVKQIAAAEIRASEAINDGSIEELHFLKIQWYMATNLYLGELLAGLRPQKLTEKEKSSLVYLGALMAITDVMVDDIKVHPERLNFLMKGSYEKLGKLSAIEQVFMLFYQKLLASVEKEKAGYIQDFSLRKPQLDSHGQINAKQTIGEIHEITRKKGGTAVLLTASLLFPITEKNRGVFYQLGAFIQYMNDSQDMYKDARAGIQTFISHYNTFDEINQKLGEEFEQTKVLLYASDYAFNKVNEFLFYLHAMFVGIIFKNKELTKRFGNSIEIEKLLLMKKATFEIQMFSMRSIIFSAPKILSFKRPKC